MKTTYSSPPREKNDKPIGQPNIINNSVIQNNINKEAKPYLTNSNQKKSGSAL